MKMRNGKPVPRTRKVDNGACCALDPFERLRDGNDYYMMPCGHYICPPCMRSSRRVVSNPYMPDGLGGVVVDRLRCSCGRMFDEEDVRRFVKFRALMNHTTIDLTDDVAIKEEPMDDE